VATLGSPDFVLVAVPRDTAPSLIALLVRRNMPALLETPPAADLPGLLRLWSDVGEANLVQVAEQSLTMPDTAATLEVVRRGITGRPTSVHVSSNHEYHTVAIMRGLLGVGGTPVTVDAHEFAAPLLDPLSFHGYTGNTEEVERVTTLARLDFGCNRSALYDFTVNQWFNPLRHQAQLPLRTVRWGNDAQTRPVVFVRHDSTEAPSPLRPGQPGNAFKPIVSGHPDLLVTKQVNSCFHGHPDLDGWLREQQLDGFVLSGITTNHCCETAARVGGNLGHQVLFALDAHAHVRPAGTRRQHRHRG